MPNIFLKTEFFGNTKLALYNMRMCIYYFLIYKTRIIISSLRTVSRITLNNVCMSILKTIKFNANVRYH